MHWFCAKPADNPAGIYLNFEHISHLVLVFLLLTLNLKFSNRVSLYGVISRKLLQTIHKFGMINKSNKNQKEGKYYEGC